MQTNHTQSSSPAGKTLPYAHLLILSLSGFLTAFGAHIVATNLPSYATLYGAGTLMIGLLIGVYDFAELFAKPVSGMVADRRGMKLTLLAGIGVFCAGSLLYLLIDPRWLLLSRFVQGLGAAALSTVSITLVAKYFHMQRGKSFGIYNAVKGGGYVIAPVCGGILSQAFGFSSLFIVCGALAAIAFFLSLLLPSDENKLDDDDDDLSFSQFMQIFTNKALLPLYSVITVNMFLVGILFGFLPVYLHKLGFDARESGSMVSVATLSYLAVQPLAGHIADRVSAKATVVSGLSVAAAATIAMVYSNGLFLVLLVVLAGLGVGVVWTNCDVMASNLAQDKDLGASMGAAQSFKELGDMLGPVLIGALTQFFGLQAGFTTCGVIALAATVMLMLSKTGNAFQSAGKKSG